MIKAIIVDDEKWSRNIIKSFSHCEKYGIEWVGEAEDGEEALEMVEKLNPHLILTDMNMPNVDGVAFLKLLQERAVHAKIIVISGYDDFAYMKQAIISKAVEYLLKPLDRVELNRALKQCVEEVYLEAQDDSGVFYKHFDKKVIDTVIQARKDLQKLLHEQDLLHLKETLGELVNGLSRFKEEEKVLTRLIHEYLGGLIQVVYIDAIRNSEEMSKLHGNLRLQVEKGLSLFDYQQQYYALVERGLDYIRSLNDLEKKSVVVNVKEFIDENFRENISLEPIAKQFYTSKEYLSGAFKKKYGLNMSQYMLNLKMEEAVKLLKQGISHTNIAERLGYQDVTYFYKVFKKYYGCTPGAYLLN